jgi:hypothetical protein
LILDPSCIVGAVGAIYHCQPGLIVKFSLPTKEVQNQLKHEASMYVHLAHQPLKVDIPAFYGILECGIGLALIISDEGEPLPSFQTLTTKQR